MAETISNNRLINYRLKPFYVSSFFHGLILWFAVEKVFMASIGLSPESITLIIVSMNISVLATEIPFGILADRWSRKGVLITSFILLIIATLTIGTANSFIQIIIGSIIFGFYQAAFSGLNESIVYDTLLEINKSRAGFEKYIGRERIVAGVSLVIGSFSGGFVADKIGLRQAFFYTIPSVLIAIFTLLKLREPKNQTENETVFLVHHIKDTFKNVFKKGIMGWIVVSAISLGIMSKFLLETDQFWPLALSVPLLLYGPLNALLLFGYGIGGIMADIITKRRIYMLSVIISFLIITGLLIKDIRTVAFSQFTIIAMYGALFIIASGKLHDSLPSRLRAGSASVVSSTTSLLFIPLVLVFGKITDKYSVFTATYILFPIAAIGLYSFIRIMKKN